MDKETKIAIIADVQAIMEKDEKDKEFLTELLDEITERW